MVGKRGGSWRGRSGFGRQVAALRLLWLLRIIRVVSVRVGEREPLCGGASGELNMNRTIRSVPVVVGRRVGKRVVVGAGVDGLRDGVRQSIRVVKRAASGVVGHLVHRHVLVGLALAEF